MAGPAPLRRGRPTVLAYLGVAAYAFLLYAMGPVTAYLRAELHLSYTLASLHSTLWAGGTVLTGLLFDRLTRRFGRRRLLWASALGSAAGAALLAAAPAVAVTLVAAGWLGLAGTLLQTGTMAVLADAHPAMRDQALVEANTTASAAAVLAPVVLGALQPTPGWRYGLAVPVLLLASLYGVFRRDRLPVPPAAGPAAEGAGARRLPRAYWPGGVLVALVVGAEFCVIYFAAQLLHGVDGVSTDAAATALVAFYLGELVGRAAGAGLTRRPGRAARLALAALAVTAVGVPLVWLTGRPAPAVAGLFVLGLGVANLYPLTLSLAVTAAGGRTDAALARTQLLVGVAVGVAPLALGALADAVGVGPAFALEPALLLAAAAMVLLWPGTGVRGVSGRSASPVPR